MKSLAVKLTLAFLLVGLTGAFVMAVFVRYRTQREFDRLILDQNQQALVANLTRYYEVYGSWKNVEAAFRPLQDPNLPNRGVEPRWEVRRALFIIADADGKVVYGGGPNNIGQKLTPRNLKQGVPLEVNNQTIGWLIFAPTINRWQPGTPEGNFLISVNQATIFSALAATGIALLLGGILAYTLTRSLRELTAATLLLAKGKLGHQVKVRSQDELGVLATSFNTMSSELARSNELRQRMTADIAHDLRTPLSVIMGYTEALNDGKLEATPEMYSVMHTEAQHLGLLIEDLKTISLAEAGELPLTRQRISPEILIQRTADSYRVKADQMQVAIQTDLPNNLPDIEVDVERMAQVLGNLMDNALRYTSAGGEIKLSAGVEAEKVRLRIADSGTGIAPDDLPYIFERSYRGDRARQHTAGETGLGLSIAKSLVEAQGGTISAESEIGKGTVFTIDLPACQ